MNKKTFKIFTAFFAAVMCILLSCSCSKDISDPDRITEIYFVSFTEGRNNLYMNEERLGDSKWGPLLKQKEAVELAHEVGKIQDAVSKEGERSYMIRIRYVEDGVEKSVEKEGYNTFPDNWDRVIELTNIVAGEYDHVSNSRELAVINAEHIRKYFPFLDESIIPDGMTLDEVIKGAQITYLDLYEPDTHVIDGGVQEMITDYLYDYLGLRAHQIEKIDEDPAKSSKDEMKEFAYSRFDEVYWEYASEYSCGGSYKGVKYAVIRYDMVQKWLEKESEHYDRCGFTGPNCQYQTEYQWEEQGYAYNYKDVFVDASGKFLILTEPGTKPGDIAAVVR